MSASGGKLTKKESLKVKELELARLKILLCGECSIGGGCVFVCMKNQYDMGPYSSFLYCAPVSSHHRMGKIHDNQIEAKQKKSVIPA